MKKLYQYMMILMAGVLGACGSMSVNDPYVDALPEDFNVQVYATLHPELTAQQYKDFVKKYNDQVKANLSEIYTVKKVLDSIYDEKYSADSAVFVANMDAVAFIYTHPLMGAHTMEEWAALVADLSLAQVTIGKLVSAYNMIGVDDDLTLLLSSVQIDYNVISQQYSIFGRDHGWAYRYCTEAEAADLLNHPNRKNLPIDTLQSSSATKDSKVAYVIDTGFYCRDALGNDRLIQ